MKAPCFKCENPKPCGKRDACEKWKDYQKELRAIKKAEIIRKQFDYYKSDKLNQT